MNKIPTRRERRAAMKFQGIRKRKGKLPLIKWMEATKDSIKQGKEIFKINQDAREKLTSDEFEQRELKLIEGWKENEYNSNEIEKLREAYSILMIKYLPTWHEDKKHARNLIKEVNKSKRDRVYG